MQMHHSVTNIDYILIAEMEATWEMNSIPDGDKQMLDDY